MCFRARGRQLKKVPLANFIPTFQHIRDKVIDVTKMMSMAEIGFKSARHGSWSANVCFKAADCGHFLVDLVDTTYDG